MNLSIEKLVEAYLKSKAGSWSEVTIRTEGYRLKGIKPEHLVDGKALYNYLSKERELKPYALRTTFIRVGELVEFAMEQGKLPVGRNEIKHYMKSNAKKFKHAYTKKTVDMSFEEAQRRIKTIQDEGVRAKALQLLFTGMRYSESTTLTEDGVVVGKGGQHREVRLAKQKKFQAKEFAASQSTLYRHLKKLGLTPHMLRKLCATKLAEMGAQEADLMKAMGWRSSNMASIYVQAQREKALADKMAQLHQEDEEDGK